MDGLDWCTRPEADRSRQDVSQKQGQVEAETDDRDSAAIWTEAARLLQFFLHEKTAAVATRDGDAGP